MEMMEMMMMMMMVWDNKFYHCGCPDGYTVMSDAIEFEAPEVICSDGFRLSLCRCVKD